jgi:hypothetical protein
LSATEVEVLDELEAVLVEEVLEEPEVVLDVLAVEELKIDEVELELDEGALVEELSVVEELSMEEDELGIEDELDELGVFEDELLEVLWGLCDTTMNILTPSMMRMATAATTTYLLSNLAAIFFELNLSISNNNNLLFILCTRRIITPSCE